MKLPSTAFGKMMDDDTFSILLLAWEWHRVHWLIITASARACNGVQVNKCRVQKVQKLVLLLGRCTGHLWLLLRTTAVNQQIWAGRLSHSEGSSLAQRVATTASFTFNKTTAHKRTAAVFSIDFSCCSDDLCSYAKAYELFTSLHLLPMSISRWSMRILLLSPMQSYSY